MGQVPSVWNALPPLLHLANSYSSFKTQLERHLLQEAFPDFPGCQSLLPLCSLYPVLPLFCLSNNMPSVVVTFRVCRPQQTVSSLRAGTSVMCLSVLNAVPAWPCVGVENVW